MCQRVMLRMMGYQRVMVGYEGISGVMLGMVGCQRVITAYDDVTQGHGGV